MPEEVSRKLADLYKCPYCTWNFIRTFNPTDKISALMIFSRCAPIHILLFSIKNKRVTILNELYSIEGKYIDYASAILFEKYEKIVCVDFRKIHKTSLSEIDRPYVKMGVSKDIVLELPENFDFYLSKLGKQTRRHIRQYRKKLEEKFPNMSFDVENVSELKVSLVRQIVAFNRLRMMKKGFKPYVTREIEEKLCMFSKIGCFVAVITLNDKVVAGTIFSIVGKNAYLDMISHDIKFDNYDLGIVCFVNTLKYCIELEVKSFHMLYGTSEYKHRFLGQDNEVYDVAIFKRQLSMILDYRKVFANFCKSKIRYFGNFMIGKLMANKRLRKPLTQIRSSCVRYLDL